MQLPLRPREASAAMPCNAASCPAAAHPYGISERIYVCSTMRRPSRNRNPARVASPIPRNYLRNLAPRAASRDAARSQAASGVTANCCPLTTTRLSSRCSKAIRRSTTRRAPLNTAGLSALRLKHQGCNPTASFKDTGMTAAVTQAKLLGARTVVCASTGNTAASLAAYAARAGMQCAILLPYGQISAAKLAQSMDYGAAICEIDGNFDDCMRLIQELARRAVDLRRELHQSVSHRRPKNGRIRNYRAARLASARPCRRSRRKYGQQFRARQGLQRNEAPRPDRSAAENQRRSSGRRRAARARCSRDWPPQLG